MSVYQPMIPSFATLLHEAHTYVAERLAARGAVQAAYVTHLHASPGSLPCWWVDVFFTGGARAVTLELQLQPDGSFLVCPLAEGCTLPSQERLAAVQRQHMQLEAQGDGLFATPAR